MKLHKPQGTLPISQLVRCRCTQICYGSSQAMGWQEWHGARGDLLDLSMLLSVLQLPHQ